MMHLAKEFFFQAAHSIVLNKKQEPRHGHSWKLQVVLQGLPNRAGIVFDFQELAKIVQEKIIVKLDHSNLNEIIAQPTAENVALWIWKQLTNLPLFSITVWETKDCSVTYFGAEKT